MSRPADREFLRELRLLARREQARPRIDVRDLVLELMRRGKEGDRLANSVLSRLGHAKKQGLRGEWRPHRPGYTPFLDVQWTSSDGNFSAWAGRMRIAAYEREFRDHGYLDYPEINPFPGDCLDHVDLHGEGGDVPNGTSKMLDAREGWDVTALAAITRTPAEKLILNLTPLHWSLALRVRYAFALEASHQDDLIQEARLKVWRCLKGYEGRSGASLTTWAYTVSHRAMIDHARRVQRRRRFERAATREGPLTAGLDFTESVVLRDTLRSAFAVVRDSDLVLCQHLGFTDAELWAGNVRMRRTRARRALQRHLADERPRSPGGRA